MVKPMKRYVLFASVFVLLSVAALSAHANSILDRVKSSGVVRVGVGNDTPPMNYIDADGKWVGFDVDLAGAVARALGVRLERVQVNNRTRVAYLANGQIDMTLSNLSHTRSRDEQIDFAAPAYLWTAKVFVAKAGRFGDIDELGGKTICVNQGSNAFTAAPALIEAFGGAAPRMLSLQRNADCMLAVRQGKADAFYQDSPIIAALAGDELAFFGLVGKGHSPGLYSIGVPPNDSKWRDAVSFALQDLIASGEYDAIYESWFGSSGRYPMAHDARPRLPADVFADTRFIWPE